MKRTLTRPGFTLIEILVSISIIALLLGIALPSLAGARTASKQLLALSNARSVGTSFALYTNSYGAYPYLEATEDMFGAGSDEVVSFEWYPEGIVIATTNLWTLDWAWPAVVSEVAPWEENYPIWVSPGKSTRLPEFPDMGGGMDDARMGEMVSWRYSNSFIGDPRLWGEGTKVQASYRRAVKDSEVSFPSQKVMLWDTHLAYLRSEPELIDGHWAAPTPMAFADGHADVKNPLDAKEGVANPLNGGNDIRLSNTPDGVAGIDY